MYCLTRNDMKFKDYFIPARTKANVITKPNTQTVDAPGVQLEISINLWNINNKPCPVSEVQIDNELQERAYGGAGSQFIGIVILTNTTEVYMDADDERYFDVDLYDWQVKRIFDDEIPKLEKGRHGYTKLRSVIEYLDNEFAVWVHDNCEFYTYTEEDIENGDCYGDAEAGDTTLSDKGIEQFENKKLEYQKKLEKIGFTYDFKGGLIWD